MPGSTEGARPAEDLVLVDAEDRPLGRVSRADAHAPGGLRHRAFSVYLFDDRGRLLLQQRQSTKPLWPGYWSNSCCSHPRFGEDTNAAATRRVREELGVTAEIQPRFVYEYCAHFGTVGTEHEVVHVYTGTVDPSEVRANTDEVAAWRMIAAEPLAAELEDEGVFTPWFHLAWPRVLASR